MTEPTPQAIEPGCVAIVGVAGRFPAARTPAELWKLLAAGREATQWLTDEELRAAGVSDEDLADPNYVRASLVLPDMEMFDAEFFGFSRRDAAILDPQHRHFTECAWEALEDAGHPPESFEGAIGVFAGCGMQAYLPYNLLTNPELKKSVGLFLLRHTGNDKDFLATRVSYLLDLKGPSMNIQTACSTSLVAVHVAAQSLLAGECDMALAGAASIELPHRHGYRFAEGEILSPDGHCRAFDENASGTLFGSGAAVVVLRRLEDALRDRDNIYAVIRGSAVNNDGSQKAGYLAPSVDGQARAAVEALGVAGVEPGSVQYIEAHGTGTPVGDPIEVAALTQAYGEGGRGFCGIGSIKTNIGHLDTAAGAASLIKVALALRHELIPPTLNFSRPNSRFDLDKTPFRVMKDAMPWKRGTAPRRAAVNSLGVGGTNAHVIVEEPPVLAGQAPAQDWQVLTLSARTPASLERLKGKWSDFLAQPPADFSLADAAFTTQVGRRGFAHRCAIVARDVAGLLAALETKNAPRAATGKAGGNAPQVVMMFPGGGASYPGAGRDLLGQPAFRAAVDECFRAMPADAPADLRELMFEREPGDAAAARLLEQPRYNIPALFVLEIALARLWESWGVRAAAVIGHSAGEYAAAVVAGVMSLADALTVVVLRGQLFEQVPAGAMLAVDLSEADLKPLLDGLALDVGVINAPDLCIASGAVDAIEALQQRLAAQGREGRRLHINVAAHSHLLDGILERFRAGVARVRLSAPAVPFVSNLSGDWADAALLADAGYWVRHLRQPVRFADGLAKLVEMGADAVLLEVGPGQGLCALARQNLQGQPRTVLPSTCKPNDAAGGDLPLMLTSLGGLWTRGVAPAWEVVRGGGQPRRISLPTYAFDHQRHWIEPGKVTLEAAAQELVPAQGLKRLPRMADWFGVPQWSPAPLPAPSAGQPGLQWLVFGSEGATTAQVLRRIAEEGGRATLVRAGSAFAPAADGSFVLDPADAGQCERLFAELERAGRLPDRVLHLWSLDIAAARTGAAALAGQALAFDSLVHIARAVQTQDIRQPMRLVVVTAGAQAVNGAPVTAPVRSLALGPVRVIPREVPTLSTLLVDLDPQALGEPAAARAIVAEALAPAGADLVGWRGGSRWVAQLVKPRSDVPPRPLVREGGVYLLTGGLGDIALELAAFLARRYRARLALVSRRTLPERARWAALAASDEAGAPAALVRRLLALEAAGAEVATYAADVADGAAMARVVADMRRRWGAVHGVFHAAGTLQDAPIAAKTPEAIAQVLAPKAVGAQVLHELLPPGQLDVFAVFSSTSVVLGPPGQVDYVAANAFLDALAASRPDGLAIRWGIWSDTGMAARAYGHGAAAAAMPAGGHPLLGTPVASDTGPAFEATYSARDFWVLREHVVAGRPVLPGTAYIEIARAAMAQLHPGAGVEIRSLSFEEAMVFEPPGRRQVRIDLHRTGDGYEFLVRSRTGAHEPWLQHARATLARFKGTLAPHAQRPAGSWREGELPQQGVDFGPRWRNIARMQLGGRHGVAEMALPERFAADLQPYALHPAVTDIAATFGLHLLDARQRAGRLFVPLSVERIRIVAPLPLRSISRVELRGPAQERFVAFDVALHTPEGAPVATFEGFSLRGIDPQGLSRQAATHAQREPNLAEAMLACGLRTEDAPALFERVLAGDAREIVVSSLSLSAVRRAMSDAAPKPLPPVASSRAPAASAVQLNPVEAVIADVWRELLGVDEIGRDDDFFALGGHSLAAVRLFARIRKQWNVDLPLATLFQGSTLAGLAALVAQAGNLDTTMPGAPTPAPASNVIQLPRAWSPLVTICRGDADRRPVFCVHGAGGNVLNFKVISDRLGPQQPFYGLQAQGVDGRLPPLSSVEAMAAQYVEAIRTVDATGPYRLAGYSGGGVIAYEMAQQLRRDGAQVETILMIDTLSPTAATRTVPLWEKIWLKRHWTLAFALDWPTRRRRAREMRRSYALALEKLARGEPLPPELVDFHLFRNFTEAQAQYRPEPYDGEIVLFRAALAETLYLYAGPTLGWDEYVRGEIRVTEIGGSHFTMMAEPGVSEVIEAFRSELARLDAGLARPRAVAAGAGGEPLAPVPASLTPAA